MSDLKTLLLAAVEHVVASGTIEKAMEEVVAKTVVEVVNGHLRAYSDFGKQVSKAVEKALAIHGDIDLPAYNHAIIKIIERQVEASTRQSIEREVATRMKELLTPAPERIRLSKLVEQYVQHLRDKHDGGCECYGEEVAFAKLHTSTTSPGFQDLTLAESREKPASYSKRRGEISIGIHLRTKGASDQGTNEVGKIYHLSYGSADVEKQMFVGPLRNFERSIFQMQAANTQIEIDCDPADCDLYYGAHERV